MVKKREKYLNKLIYCGNCASWINPVIITKGIFYYPVYEIEKKPVFNKKGKVREYVDEVIKTNEITKIWQTLKCSTPKCNAVYLQTYEELEGIQYKAETIIPKHQSWHIKPIPNFEDAVPEQPYELYLEAVNAYNFSMHFSCGILLGGILESICQVEGIKQRIINERIVDALVKGKSIDPNKKFIINLQEQVLILIDSGKIPNKFQKMVEDVKELRNEVTHDIYIPTDEELEVCIKIIIEIFEEMYWSKNDKRLAVLEQRLETLKNRR